MSTPGRVTRATALGAAVALALGLLAAVAAGLPASFEKPAKARLTVTQQGAVSGLFPGRASSVTVVVRNPSKHAVKLKAVTAVPATAGPCPATMLTIGQPPAAVLRKALKARRSLTVQLPVTLARHAPDACQGRTFPLALKATGTAVRKKR